MTSGFFLVHFFFIRAFSFKYQALISTCPCTFYVEEYFFNLDDINSLDQPLTALLPWTRISNNRQNFEQDDATLQVYQNAHFCLEY